MGIGAHDLSDHEWQVVDAEAMTYIKHLVESLQHLTFDEACMVQITADDNAADSADLFTPHRPVVLTGDVPFDVASALNTLEELLSRGSPTLAAYKRKLYREGRAFQEEKVRLAMAEFQSLDDLVVERLDLLDGIRERLTTPRAAKQQAIERIAAATWEEDTSALWVDLGEADEREAAATAEFLRLWPSYVTMCRHRAVADARVRSKASTLLAMPALPGHWEDEVVIDDAEERYMDSVFLLRDFLL